MATSPDYLRLATNATRALADTALDCLRDAVLVVDARHKQLPLVLANAAARRCFAAENDEGNLIAAPLARLLGTASAATIETMMVSQSGAACTGRIITWRFIHGEQPVMTDIKPLAAAPGQRLVMLSFAPAAPEPDVVVAVDQLSWDMLILDTELKVTYANAGAVRAARSMVRDLGGRPVKISAHKKRLYHAAAALAAGHVLAVEEAATRMLMSAGMNRHEAVRSLLGLTRQVLENFERLGSRAAWTGPLARGDYRVISAHEEAMSELPTEYMRAYEALNRLGARVLANDATSTLARLDKIAVAERQTRKSRRIARD